MLNENDLSAINRLLESNYETWPTYIAYFLASLVGAFVGGYLSQKAKNKANSEDFDGIKNQLKETTKAVQEIESSFSEKGWITQQVWLRKQSAYESILNYLLDIKKYVGHQVEEFHEWNYIYNRYHYQEFVNDAVDGDGSLWENEKSKYEKMKASPETKEAAELLKKNYDKALADLFDHIEVKAIYLSKKVSLKIEELKRSLNTASPEESWDDHFYRIESDTNEAITSIRMISIEDLKI